MSLFELTTPAVFGEMPTTRPIYPGSGVISSGSMVIELDDPSKKNTYYTGVRFSPVAAIISARVGGNEFLYHAEKHNPQTDVAGLFSDFDLVTAPPGFAQAKIGEPFLKIGVGSLVKTTENYQFYNPYSVHKLANTDATWLDDRVSYVQTYDEKGDYAYRLEATVLAKENDLIIDWSLTNLGRTEIVTHHYSHNSFRFDNRTPGPGYVLSFPFDYVASGLRSDTTQNGRQIEFTKTIEKPVNIAVNYPNDYQGSNSFELENAQQSVLVTTSIPGLRVALHVAPQYICPEQFVVIGLQPGETKRWQRKYQFNQIAR